MPPHKPATTNKNSATPRRPWQKNIKEVPAHILAQVQHFSGNACVASCAKKLKISDIERGVYEHLGIRIADGKLIYSKQIIPPAWVGKYSRWNREVREIIQKDQPKYEKSRGILTPNYGDWSNGSHIITVTQEV